MLKRLLIVPLISTKGKIWRESDFITWFQFCKSWPDVYIYMLVNAEAEIPDEYRLDNIEYVPIVDWVPFSMAQSCVTSEMLRMFNPLNGEIQVDCVLTAKTAAAAPMKRAFFMGDKTHIPVFISEQKSSNFGETHDSVTDLDLMLRSVSYAQCYPFFGTAREKQIAINAAKRYMTPHTVAQIDRQGYARSMGVPLQEIHDAGKTTPKYDDFTLLFAARFNSNKRWDGVLAAFEKYCKMNKGVRGIGICPSMPINSGVELTHYQSTEIREALPRNEYVDTLLRSHISVSMSVEEGFAFGWAEQIATGHPVLFPDKPWARGLMPAAQYEKCFYKNESQLLALIKYVQSNYEEFCAEIAPAVKWFVKEHDLPHAAQQYREHMWDKTTGTYEVFKDWHPRLLRVLDDMPNEFSMMEFKTRAAKDGLLFGQMLRQLSTMSSYRNLWFWLRENAVPLHKPGMVFSKCPKT